MLRQVLSQTWRFVLGAAVLVNEHSRKVDEARSQRKYIQVRLVAAISQRENLYNTQTMLNQGLFNHISTL